MSMTKKLLLTGICVAAVMLLSGQVMAADSGEEIRVRRIEMAMPAATVRVNQERILYVEVIPSNADDRTITWSSGNPEVAMVWDDGTVIGISPGTAEVTAVSGNGKTAVCQVTVPDTVLTEIELQTGNEEHPLSGLNGGERLSAAVLRRDMEAAAKNTPKNQTATVTYTDKTQVSTTALRSAAFAAKYQGRDARVIFRTLDSDGKIQGQLTLNPGQAAHNDWNMKVGVTTDPQKTADVRKHASDFFDAPVAVIRLAQSGSYGMRVQVAAKADLSGMDLDALELYSCSNGKYALLDQQDCRADKNGYLHFETEQGGYIVVVSR